LVTWVIATSEIAITDSAPIGIALPMIAAMVATNSASRCQASGLTWAGAGITNQIKRPMPRATADGISLGREDSVMASPFGFGAAAGSQPGRGMYGASMAPTLT